MKSKTLHKKDIKGLKSFLNSQLDLSEKIVVTETSTSIGKCLHLEITLKDKSIHRFDISDTSCWQ